MAKLDDNALERAGTDAAALIRPGTDWVHRRVQSLSYLEHDLQRIRLSVDYTPPGDHPSALLPITVLPKWPPVFRFDLRNGDGQTIPLLTSQQNGIADHALVLELARIASPMSLQFPLFAAALETLARGPDTSLDAALDAFFENLQSDLDSGDVGRLADIAALLVDNTFLWVPAGRRDERTIAKLEYVAPSVDTPSRRARALRSLSWQLPEETIQLRHCGADANFHLEIEAPPVLVVRSTEVSYYWLTDEPGKAEQPPEATDAAAEGAGLRPEQHLARRGRFAHLYVSGRRPMGADAFFTMAPARSGFITASLVAALLIALLATAFYFARDQAGSASNVDAAVTLLALFPALVSYLVLRPTDHPLTRQYLIGVQILLSASAAVPVVMAVLLVIYADRSACLQNAWVVAMIGSWLPVAGLLLSWHQAGDRTLRR